MRYDVQRKAIVTDDGSIIIAHLVNGAWANPSGGVFSRDDVARFDDEFRFASHPWCSVCEEREGDPRRQGGTVKLLVWAECLICTDCAPHYDAGKPWTACWICGAPYASHHSKGNGTPDECCPTCIAELPGQD